MMGFELMRVMLGLVVIFALYVVGVCFAMPSLLEDIWAGIAAIFG